MRSYEREFNPAAHTTVQAVSHRHDGSDPHPRPARHSDAEPGRFGGQADGGAAGPTRNRILRALPEAEHDALLQQFELVTLRSGQVLIEPGAPTAHVFFPASAVLSVVNLLAQGGAVEVGTIGNEGMGGLSVFLDADAAPSQLIAQVPGDAYQMTAASLVAAAASLPSLERILRRYTHAYLTQVAQTASCNRAHDVAERCARWLLMTHDRVGGRDSFFLTHEFLAFMLGVRRAGVTVAAGILQRAGLIRYTRGRITVLDRAGLEAASCDCYGIVRAHFDRLFNGKAAST